MLPRQINQGFSIFLLNCYPPPLFLRGTGSSCQNWFPCFRFPASRLRAACALFRFLSFPVSAFFPLLPFSAPAFVLLLPFSSFCSFQLLPLFRFFPFQLLPLFCFFPFQLLLFSASSLFSSCLCSASSLFQLLLFSAPAFVLLLPFSVSALFGFFPFQLLPLFSFFPFPFYCLSASFTSKSGAGSPFLPASGSCLLQKPSHKVIIENPVIPYFGITGFSLAHRKYCRYETFYGSAR